MSDVSAAQQHVLDEAQRVNEERMKAVEQLATAVARRVELERQVHEAQKKEKKLMAAAEKAGWTRAQVARFAKPPKTTKRTTSGPNAGTTEAGSEDVSRGTPTSSH